jgi:hypothetical protein
MVEEFNPRLMTRRLRSKLNVRVIGVAQITLGARMAPITLTGGPAVCPERHRRPEPSESVSPPTPKEHPSLTAVAPTSRVVSQGYRPPPSRYCPTRRFPAKRGRRNMNLLILSGSTGDQRAWIPCLERSEMQVFPSSAQARSER